MINKAGQVSFTCGKVQSGTECDIVQQNNAKMFYLNLRHDISTRDFHELAPLDYPAYQRFFLACRRPRTRAAKSQEKTFRFTLICDMIFPQEIFMNQHHQITLCTRGLPRLPKADDTSGEVAFRAGHFFRLDRNGKPRMKSLWHAGYPQIYLAFFVCSKEMQPVRVYGKIYFQINLVI